MTTEVALALATAVHAGFQVTVTVLVYPALVAVGPDEWDQAHRQHSRRIVPVVAVVYLALVVAAAARVVDAPDVAGWVAVALVAAAFGVTAVFAAPIHGRLRAGTTHLHRRLLVVDRVRCCLAVGGLVAALVSLL